MSNKWNGLHGPITAADAEAEPEYERLFSRPPRRPKALPKTIDVARVRETIARGQPGGRRIAERYRLWQTN
jgi:hypothetical protein